MAFYQLYREQKIPSTIDEVWKFISSPANLKEITPGYMGFDITTPDLPETMYEGMIVGYKVKPFPGYQTSWVTEITHVKEKQYFVDEQRIGPYKLWHHQHILSEVENGVLMKDIVSYKPPYGPIGQLANILFIRRKLRQIFEYRFHAIKKRFPDDM